MKTCNKCKNTKQLTEFGNDKRNKDGLQGICNDCKNQDKAQRRVARAKNKTYKTVESKDCNKCGEHKPIAEFYKDKAMGDGHASICKVCKHGSVTKWRQDNKDRYNASMRAYQKANPEQRYGHEIKRRYGCTLEEYNQRLTDQQGKCAICGELHNPAEKKGRLFVDHCHKGGQVRDLLCGDCNSGLGYFKDNPDLLQKAIDYLKKHTDK